MRWYHHLYHALVHPFNILLLSLAGVAGGTEDWQTFVVLTGMVGISVVIRFTQEMSSAISAEALKKKVEQKVQVRRPIESNAASGGTDVEMKRSLSSQSSDELKTWRVESVNFTSIVPGDVVELAAGSLIPGDLRVIRTLTMLVNQGVLTGESLAVEKTFKPFVKKVAPAIPGNTDANADGDVEHLHRDNLCFMGTSVESGSAAALVLSTGERTHFGQHAKQLVVERPQSAFAKGVKRVSYVLMLFMAVMMPLVVVINGLSTGDWSDAGLFGLAVAVGLTPEMLPVRTTLFRSYIHSFAHSCHVMSLYSCYR